MKLLNKKNVRILEGAGDWQEAIRISVKPLEEQGFVDERYQEAIISNVESMGPYIIIAPYIALPHARPEQGVIKTQIGITLFRNAIIFDEKKSPIKLFITLAAADNNSHLDALMSISEILQNDEKVTSIMNSENAETLYRIFNGKE